MTRTDEYNDGYLVTRKDNVISGPKIPYELLKGGIGKFYFDSCLKHKDKICQIHADTGAKDTFSTLLKKSIRVAIAMKARGIRKSDMIMHCSPNTPEAALPIVAGTFLGAISSSLDPTLSPRDCAHLIDLIQPKMMFVHEGSVGLIEETLEVAQWGEVEIVVLPKNQGKYISFERFLEESEEEEAFRPICVEDCEETIFVLFSSGTTGLPKGICLGHQALYCGCMSFYEEIEDKSCLMHFTTFYWISALMIFTCTFIEGNKRLLITGFDADKTFKAVDKYRVSHMFMASSCIHQVTSNQNLHKLDLSCLKQLMLGGGPVSTDQMHKLRKALPDTYASLGYGMTEMGTCITCFGRHDRALSNMKPSSCGRPAYEISIKVVDVETGDVLGENKSGEIRLKYAHIMNGYYKQDCSSVFDEEGFMKTGDIGHYDESLCLYVYDRIKDMFKYQSWHIVPASIEAVLKEHPEVAQVVVFGIPDEVDGDLPAAAVVLVDGARSSDTDIAEFVAERVHDRQRLRGGVHIMRMLPTTPSGKLLRRKAREEILKKLKKN